MDEPRLPFTVGLTGGIGSGKSTIARLFSQLGAEVVDADRIARELVAAGSPALEEIAAHFGPQILTAGGELDRAALRDRVFRDPRQKQWLEEALHPRVREEIRRRLTASRADYVILEVPLLLESGHYDFVNRVLVVDVPEDIQVERTARRDAAPPESVRRIMAAQMGRGERLGHADDVLNNTLPLEQVKEEVKRLHDYYRRQAAQWRQSGHQEG